MSNPQKALIRMNADRPSAVAVSVSHLMSTMSADDVNALRDTLEGGLIMYRFSLGMHIRNGFGLSKGDNDLLKFCCGEINDPWIWESVMNYPDKASGVIIHALLAKAPITGADRSSSWLALQPKASEPWATQSMPCIPS